MIRNILILFILINLIGCANTKQKPTTSTEDQKKPMWLSVTTTANIVDCLNLGQIVSSGQDLNFNNILDENEISDQKLICDPITYNEEDDMEIFPIVSEEGVIDQNDVTEESNASESAPILQEEPDSTLIVINDGLDSNSELIEVEVNLDIIKHEEDEQIEGHSKCSSNLALIKRDHSHKNRILRVKCINKKYKFYLRKHL